VVTTTFLENAVGAKKLLLKLVIDLVIVSVPCQPTSDYHDGIWECFYTALNIISIRLETFVP
jgi:hypothetical protein